MLLKRFEDELMRRLDTVAWKGFAVIEWWELNAWYDAQRIGKTVWQDLHARFTEAKQGDAGDLWIYEAHEGLLLIHSDSLAKIMPDGTKHNVADLVTEEV